MANIRNKIYNWLKSAAGMIACGLFFGTMALLYLFKFYYGEFSEADCKNLWIGLAVNFFASIFTVSLVQMVFEQEKKRSEQIEEKLLIERAHKIASRLIHRYILAFNCVVVPLDDRDNMSVEDLQSN